MKATSFFLLSFIINAQSLAQDRVNAEAIGAFALYGATIYSEVASIHRQHAIDFISNKPDNHFKELNKKFSKELSQYHTQKADYQNTVRLDGSHSFQEMSEKLFLKKQELKKDAMREEIKNLMKLMQKGPHKLEKELIIFNTVKKTSGILSVILLGDAAYISISELLKQNNNPSKQIQSSAMIEPQTWLEDSESRSPTQAQRKTQ